VSTRGAVQAIRQAKARGIHVTAEVAPHHLILTDEIAITKGTLAKVNPPLRPKENLDACIEGLLDGTLDIIATDHAPHTAADKGRDFDKAAFGMVGLETAVPLMLLLVERGLLTPMRMIEAMSTLPARIFRLPGGTLIPGTIADITLIDPKAEHVIDSSTFLSKSRNTPFDGTKVPGCAVGIVVGGNLILNHCEGSAR
jgi:dihydroorotase